jgi:hypothetical protein
MNHRGHQAGELAPKAFSTYHFLVPTTWTIPSEDQVDAAAQSAETLARAAKHGGGSPLPDLANSKIDESTLRKIQDFLNSLFKFNSSPRLDLWFVMQFLKWILLALVVIGLGYVIYRLLARARGPAAEGSSLPVPTLSTEGLVLDLERALEAGEFARAARLRWRLFLLRSRRTPDMTPYEHFVAQRATLEGWLAKQYRTMFAGGTKGDYDDLRSRLESLEEKIGSEA